MDFITLLIFILAFTLIISILWSVTSMGGNDAEVTFSEELQDQDLQSYVEHAEEPFVPEVGLGRFVAALPEDYWGYFEHSSDEPYEIPQRNSVTGNLRMLFVWQEAIVVIGTHTELRFDSIDFAYQFVGKVLGDEIVFRIGEKETTICPIDDFKGPGEADRNDYVWSGPLKHKLLFRD